MVPKRGAELEWLSCGSFLIELAAREPGENGLPCARPPWKYSAGGEANIGCYENYNNGCYVFCSNTKLHTILGC